MSEKQRTSLGTPCSPAWDTAWIQTVDTAEQKAGHRLCGARTLDGTPCTLEPNHENGRCRYHGGFALTGAQPGNRNAVIHGLYARGLQRCGAHCPQWAWCPLPNMPGQASTEPGRVPPGEAQSNAPNNIERLAPRKRPVCPYEASQFQTALSDLLATLPNRAGTCFPQLIHQIALLQVMIQRATGAMAVTPLTENTHVESGNYNMDTAKPAAALAVYTRLAAEHRRALGLLLKILEHNERIGYANLTDAERYRRSIDTEVTPEAQAELHLDEDECTGRAWGLIREAEEKLRGRKEERERYLENEAEDREADEEAEAPRTQHGFVEQETEEDFQQAIKSIENAANHLYQRAYWLAPQLKKPYTTNPANAQYRQPFDATPEAPAPP